MKKNNDYDNCLCCNQTMAPEHGCIFTHIAMNGSEYRRIKAGTENDHIKEGDICRGCNVGYGQYHHCCCVLERCPICDGRLLSCDCPKRDMFLLRRLCDDCLQANK